MRKLTNHEFDIIFNAIYDYQMKLKSFSRDNNHYCFVQLNNTPLYFKTKEDFILAIKEADELLDKF